MSDVTTFYSLEWVRFLPPDVLARVSPDGKVFTIEWQGEIKGKHRFFHVDVAARGDMLSEEIGAKAWLAPMVNNLWGARLNAEFGYDYTASFRWEVEAATGTRNLTEHERSVIAKRKELVWRPTAAR